MRIKEKTEDPWVGGSFNEMRRVECEGPHGMHKSCYNPTLVKNRESTG